MSWLKRTDFSLDVGTTRVRLFERGRGVILDAAVEDLLPEAEIPDRGERQKALIKASFAKAGVRTGLFGRVRRLMLAIPSVYGDVERFACEKAAACVRASDGVYLIESPMAAALGADGKVSDPQATTVVDIGASRIQVAVISLAGIAVFRGDARTPREGVAALAEQTAGLIRSALSACLAQERYNLVDDIVRKGVVLTGGGAEEPGLADALHASLNLPVKVTAEPRLAIIKGAGIVLGELDLLVLNGRKESAGLVGKIFAIVLTLYFLWCLRDVWSFWLGYLK